MYANTLRGPIAKSFSVKAGGNYIYRTDLNVEVIFLPYLM
jgi:hypothetical protein